MRLWMFSTVLLGACFAAPQAARTETIAASQPIEVCEASPFDLTIEAAMRAVRPPADLRVPAGRRRALRVGGRVKDVR